MKTLIIDPQLAGCSGDMIVAALVDLTKKSSILEHLVDTINEVLKTDMSLSFSSVLKKGLSATQLDIRIDKDLELPHATELKQALEKVLTHLSLSSKAKKLALKIFQSLIDAESRVHQLPSNELHLHETASVDTIFDIVGTVLLLEAANLIEVPILGLPVNTGKGIITISHGKVTVPPPAVLEILSNGNYLSFSDNAEGELLTPTGAAILTNLVTDVVTQLPPHNIIARGYGAGMKDLKDRANILRLYLADIPSEPEKRYLSMLETHLDDVSGEILGNLMTSLLKEGALDVSYYSLYMKKNRPGWCLRVICEEKDASELAYLLMKESGTLGVRESRFGRYELERKVVSKKVVISGKEFTCRFKERLLKGKLLGVKPEFEDVKKISKETKMTLIDTTRVLIQEYYKNKS